MDEVKDFFKELRERASSPLIGSFVISWSVINWDVIIACLFNNSDTLKHDRYIFIHNIIVSHSHWWNMALHPLLWAIFYVTVYPFVKRKIKWYTAWQTTKGDAEILKTSGLEPVSLENYLIMVEAQKKSHNELSTLINSQLEVLREKSKLETELELGNLRNLEADRKIAEIQTIIRERQAFSIIDSYVGVWTYAQDVDGKTEVKTWNFSKNKVIIDKAYYNIMSFIADYDKRQLSLILRPEKQHTFSNFSSSLVIDNLLTLHFLFLVNKDISTMTSPADFIGTYSMRKGIFEDANDILY